MAVARENIRLNNKEQQMPAKISESIEKN